MDLTRRRLLQASAAAGAGLLLPQGLTRAAAGLVPAGVIPFTEPLPTLADLGVLDMTAGGSAVLEMANGQHSFHSAMGSTGTFRYRVPGSSSDHQYLGPVILAEQDVGFDLRVVNSLGRHPLDFAVDPDLVPAGSNDKDHPRAATHLHGGNTTTQSDGGPLDVFSPGDFWDYRYDNTQEAAGLWYHDHAVGITRLNVYAGLASGYLIRNQDDPGDGNVLPAPPYEVPLVIQDRMFRSDGSFDYPPNPFTQRAWAPEFFGDVATVNGKAWPDLPVDRGTYRFRVYNGSNARFYNLKIVDPLGDALVFFQIGSDGGLLNAPVKLNKLLLGPGERADLVVDFAALPPGAVLTLVNDARTPFPNGPRALRRGGAPLRQIMRFTVTDQPGFSALLPTSLRTTPVTPLANNAFTASRHPVAQRRTMTLVEILDPLQGPLTALLNNRMLHDPDFQGAPVASDSLEQWDLVNLTGDAHPIHLHFTQFQVLNRQRIDAVGYHTAVYGPGPLVPGSGTYYGDGVQPYPGQVNPPVAPFLRGGSKSPPANERGWKDTVVAMPGEVTRILVPFGPGAAGDAVDRPMAIGAAHTGTYVWHCHILEHEDNDMMQHYTIV
jgi:spore coat protein A, manganese oxidase